MTSIMTPPALWTHLPIDSPTVEVTTIRARITAAASATNQPLFVIHAALGPSAYDRYVAHVRPISDVNTIT